MSSRQAPQRVFALQSADADKAYLFGVGTYVGDLRAPWCEGEPDEDTRQSILNVLKADDEREDPFAIGMIEWSLSQGHLTEEEAEKAKLKAYANQKKEAARPIEERVKECWELLNTNPCINLDDGNTIWGAQCWWGPEERLDEKVQGREIVTVPVPATNPRWK